MLRFGLVLYFMRFFELFESVGWNFCLILKILAIIPSNTCLLPHSLRNSSCVCIELLEIVPLLTHILCIFKNHFSVCVSLRIISAVPPSCLLIAFCNVSFDINPIQYIFHLTPYSFHLQKFN